MAALPAALGAEPEAVMTMGDIYRVFAAAAVVAAVMAVSAGARAEFMEGNDLYDACTDPDSKLVCLGYVMAIADAAQAPAAVKRSPMCPGSEDVTAEQMVDVVTRYLASHRETRHLSAPLLVANALAEAYPCP